MLEDYSIHAWINKNKIKTEKGVPIEFDNHLFLFHPYSDMHPFQVCLKAAQIGFSVMAIIKTLHTAKSKKLDIIYTMPTDNDMSVFAGGKVNRIIANNPILIEWTKDKDTVEQKKMGSAMTYWRGTFSKKAAISVTSDLNIHDEVDFSDQEVVDDYESRLQHSQYKGQWFFGHPSTEGVGVSKYWDRSDQKHWFINCPHCKKEQFMKFPESICFERRVFQCKYCHGILSNEDRRVGRWVAKYKLNSLKDGVRLKFSGYWIPLLIAPWIEAEYIIEKYDEKDAEFFYNRVLGLPYVGSGNKVTQNMILGNLTDEINPQDGRVVIGCDTGTHLRYVIGNQYGIFHYGQEKDTQDKYGNVLKSKYEKIHYFMKRWPEAIIAFDQAGDRGDGKAVREFRAKYPGRVYLSFYREDRKTMEVVKWDDDKGEVIIDRNKMIQILIDEMADRCIPLFGSEKEWWDYWLHWDKIYRVCEETSLGTKRYKWLRSGRDDYVHATVYWRAVMSRFSGVMAKIYNNNETKVLASYEVNPNQTVTFNPRNPAVKNIAKVIDSWEIH